MENTKRILLGQLKEGDVIFNHGFVFKVSEITREKYNDESDVMIIRYTGKTIDHKRNELIKNTGYNGGRYGGLSTMEVVLLIQS